MRAVPSDNARCWQTVRRARFGRALALVLLTALASGGCKTYAKRLESARTFYCQGQWAEAATALEDAQRRHDGTTDLVQLEQSLVDLAGGRPAEAEKRLRAVRDRFDHLEQASLAESTLSLLTDDTKRAYAGEDYEKVLIRVFLSLANLMHDGGDAEAYCLQVLDKQQQLIAAAAEKDGTNPKAAYRPVALGSYLRGVLREATHRDYDDAARAYTQVVSWQPGFAPGPADLHRATHGRHSERGHGVLYVFALVGRGPYKTEVSEMPSTASMLIADRILSGLGKQTLPPTLAPIKVPAIVAAHNTIGSLGVDIDGRPATETQTITDVTDMAVSQCAALRDRTVARALVRRAVKKATVYAAKEVAGIDKHSFAGLAFDLAGVAYEATESADTRSWSLLPDSIQVVRLELPAGNHEIALRPLTKHKTTSGRPVREVVTIRDARNTYILASFPTETTAGKLLLNAP